MSKTVVDTDEIRSAAAQLDAIADRLDAERARVSDDIAPHTIAGDPVSSAVSESLGAVAAEVDGSITSGTAQVRALATALRSVADEYTAADGFESSGLTLRS